MKAIHNKPTGTLVPSLVGNYKLKYNFESNSQHHLINPKEQTSW
nr:hypothetical protein [Flavobacterium psychrophilum]